MPFLAPAVPFIGAGLSALGSISKGRAGGRQAEAQARLQQQQAALDAARFNREAPFARAGAGVRGDILAGVQPVSFTGTGRDLRISGGLSPALLSSGTRQIGQLMSRDALLSALGGPQRSARPSLSQAAQQRGDRSLFRGARGLRDAAARQPAFRDPYTFDPSQFAPPRPGFLDRLGNVAGLVGGGLELLQRDEEPGFVDPDILFGSR
jgi:hypothetical protein